MAIVIAGGAGFIGSHLVDFYVKHGKKVIVLDNLSTGKKANIEHHPAEKVEFHEVDIVSWDGLPGVLEEAEAVFNLAAVVGMFNVLENPIATLRANVRIADTLLEEVAKLRIRPPVLIASSSEVYGSRSDPMKESDSVSVADMNRAHASYAVSKLCNEATAEAWYKEEKVPVKVVRIFNTVGPRQTARYGMVLPRFVRQAVNGDPITIFSNGEQTRAFCDVRDMANLLHQVMFCEQASGEIVNVGSDNCISILQLAERVKKMAQSESILSFQSYEEVYGKEYMDMENRRPNLEKLKSLIAYRLHWTLEDTIRDTIDAVKAGLT